MAIDKITYGKELPEIVGYSTEIVCKINEYTIEDLGNGKVKIRIYHED